MKSIRMRGVAGATLPIVVTFVLAVFAGGCRSEAAGPAATASAAAAEPQAGGPVLIQPAELVNILKSPKAQKPLVIQVGFYVLYVQAHIPGSEYVGPASSPEGLQMLRQRVASLPRTQPIVVYCGCCPWSQCPTVGPAYQMLRGMSFTNVKALYIARNFGVDWVQLGYPVARGR